MDDDLSIKYNVDNLYNNLTASDMAPVYSTVRGDAMTFVIIVLAPKILPTLKGLGHEIKLNFLWPKINISRCKLKLSCFCTFIIAF